MRGPILEHLVQQFETGADATIRIHDYRVQRFDIPLDLQGIGEGLSALKGLQNCFSAGSPTSPAASGD